VLLLAVFVTWFWIFRAVDRVGVPFEPASHVWQPRLFVPAVGAGMAVIGTGVSQRVSAFRIDELERR
jgi:hypothetical protein